MHQLKYYNEVYKDVGDMSFIICIDNNIFVVGVLDLEDELIQQEINKIIDNDNTNYNIFYARDFDLYNTKV